MCNKYLPGRPTSSSTFTATDQDRTAPKGQGQNRGGNGNGSAQRGEMAVRDMLASLGQAADSGGRSSADSDMLRTEHWGNSLGYDGRQASTWKIDKRYGRHQATEVLHDCFARCTYA